MNNRTIKVIGQGSIKLKPDLMCVTITLEDSDKDYETVLKRSSEKTEALKALLEGFGFTEQDLKTLDFSIDTLYEPCRENDVYQNRFAGFKFRHQMKLELDHDNDRLGKILYALSKSKLEPEFSVSFKIKDIESAKNELLAKAVEDASSKAKILASASGLSLKEILSIEYSSKSLDPEIRPMGNLRCKAAPDLLGASGASLDLDINPDDKILADSVCIVWAIE